jgi:hypothetical protein
MTGSLDNSSFRCHNGFYKDGIMKNHFQIKSVDEDPQRMAIRAIYQVAGSLNKCEDIFFDKEEISSKHQI